MIERSAASQFLYEKLKASEWDFRLARHHAEHLLKKKWHKSFPEMRGEVYWHQAAYTSALVVAYGRPFTKGYGWPRLPSELHAYDAVEVELHKRMIEKRDKMYAHTDSATYHAQSSRVVSLKANEKSPLGTFYLYPTYRITASEAKLLVTMISKVLNAIGERVRELEEKH